MQIGVIADTHSKMRPEALDVLKGSDLILHVGDVGRDEVLEALEAIAPVIAIRGNIDKTGRAATLPDVQDLEFLGHAFHMLHDVKTLQIDPQGRYRVVIAGHSVWRQLSCPVRDNYDGRLGGLTFYSFQPA